VGFATAHRLGELEEGLLRLALEATERLHQEGLHAFGDLVFLEKALLVDFTVREVSEVQDGIALGHVKDAVARGAKFLEGFIW